MITDQHLAGLVDLVRQRYPDWEDVAHPGFAADELAYKRAAAAKAQAQLSRQALDDLIAAEAFDDCLARLERLGNDTNLLWRRVPSAGDTAVLNHPHLDKATFCTQLRNLLHGDRPAPQRLQSFSDYLASHDLPNGWPFPTYFLFLLHPETELFVKPRAAHWFLRYVGETAVTVTTPPTADTYARLREHARDLLAALAEFGAQDLIDVQSILWVAHRESRARAGRLDARGQVELEIPPAS
ncbi:MAG: hypothetical protein KC425_20065, partial [Anaerolineales bacterium]|nr:hypothetical protein [Anaerolineales bacterium]